MFVVHVLLHLLCQLDLSREEMSHEIFNFWFFIRHLPLDLMFHILKCFAYNFIRSFLLTALITWTYNFEFAEYSNLKATRLPMSRLYV